MDVEDAVRALRVVRRFSEEAVSDADILAILKAGRRTGSSKNSQQWHFIVIRGRDLLGQLAQVGDYASHLAGADVAVALLTPDPATTDSPYSVMWDLGRAAQNMVLTAWSRGIGSVPATVYDQELCRRLLGYPADWHCEFVLSFGHPASPDALTRPLRSGGRRALGEMVSRETWPSSRGQ